MISNMLVERMKLAGHIETQERAAFSLTFAREDRRLGPQIKPSATDCTVSAQACGLRTSGGVVDGKAVPFEEFASWLAVPSGRPVIDRTGVSGRYDVQLHFTAAAQIGASSANPDAPHFFTALQEQLGLKRVPEKATVKIFVVDRFERPTPD
jgi:uncharacterized protein (TIGR03435 family)